MNPSLLRTGDVLHCSGKSFISKLIKKITKSKWSHTAVFIKIWDQPYIIEAQRRGVYPKPFYEWLKKYGYDFEVSRNPNLDKENLETFSIRAMSKSGSAYDFESLLIRHPWRLITGNWKKKLDEDDVMICSEYALWCHWIKKSYLMTPDDVYEYCQRTNWLEIKDPNNKNFYKS